MPATTSTQSVPATCSRHVADYFETTYEERMALARLIDDCREISEREHHPDGYNIGVNTGEAAGQNVMHVHIHFIPRYRGARRGCAGLSAR